MNQSHTQTKKRHVKQTGDGKKKKNRKKKKIV